MKSGPTKRGTGSIMLEFFRKLFKKKDKSGSGLTQIKYDTQQDWQKRITRAKEKPKIPRIDQKIRALPRRRITIIAIIAGAGLGIWFGVQYYQSPLAMYSLNVARNPEDGGNVSAICAGTTSPTHANYRDGTAITLVATPSPGYDFISWSGDASGTSPSTTVTMDSDKTVTARFDTIQYQLQVYSSPSEGGMVNTSGGTYDPDTTVTLVATPSPGYDFISWSGDASGTSPSTTVTMDSDKTATARFDTIQYQLQIYSSPSEGGMVSTSGGTYDPDTTVTLVATPSPGYEFVSWSGDASGTSPSTTITMDSDKTVTARFDTIAQYIDYTMEAGEISGSVVSFSKVMERGEKIQGYVELTGEYKTRDRTFRWNFEIINPEGRPEDIFRGHWVNETYHEFDLKAVYKGEYQIKIDHNSRYDLHLVIEIIPKGWQSSKPQ